ncbi:MAG: DUF3108 domain-containing protein [Pseudomonadota bacterium]
MRTLAIIAGLSAFAASSEAATETVTALYDLRWEGLKVGEFRLDLDIDETTYAVRYQAESTGFVDTLADFRSQGSSQGFLRDGELEARAYRGMSQWRGGGSEWSVRFDADGQVDVIDIPEDSIEDRGPVADDLKVAPDPFALALQTIFDVVPGAVIEGASFDGKRAVRYQLECPDIGGNQATSLDCRVIGRLVAGGSREWRERTGDEPAAPEPVLLTFEQGIFEGHYWPVRVTTTSRFGEVAVELVDASSSSEIGQAG